MEIANNLAHLVTKKMTRPMAGHFFINIYKIKLLNQQ